MQAVYRVFPWLERSEDDEPGGALYIPAQGGGRLDNPDIHSVLYLSDSPAGAIAEAFGRFPEWTPAILAGGSALPGSVRAIAAYSLPEEAAICDLNDPQRLIDLGLCPADVVTRDYEKSRAWARQIWTQKKWIGVRWWSYYDPRWASFGLWNLAQLKLLSVKELGIENPDLLEASRIIVRRVIARKRAQTVTRQEKSEKP